MSGTQCAAPFSLGAAPASAPAPSPTQAGDHPAWSVRVATGPLASLALSPDGQLLVTGDASPAGNDTAQLWTAAGARVATLAGHRAPVTCLAWSPDGLLLASGSRDGDVRLWDRLGHLVRTLGGTDPVFSLAWSPHGTVLAVGAIHFPAPAAGGMSALPGVIHLWNQDGTLLRTLGTQLTGGKFLNLTWSPDGSFLASGAVDYHVWQADGTEVGVVRAGGTPAWAMAWSPDGRTLAIGDENGVLDVVASNGTSLGRTQLAGDVNGLSFSPDGAALAVGQSAMVTVVRPTDPGSALWSAPAAQAKTVWSPDGRLLAIARSDGLSIVRDSGSLFATLTGCPGTPATFAWTGAFVAAVTDQGWLCGWPAVGS